ncbi:hypothetical protein GCM10010404_07050 [Nonomuraea africana]|uniref:Enoyl-CoA hydratase/carnithine racemase n=1 Tax=Nonomuraea africana TaxID=46171 RepID=A0ABR9KKJ8_9ACTN|nr:enoyl-CoA hydratase-related protein [Nonomuraea africana]MBE1562549.1 enoyl-CoA hydratase/carnithine racemase [Nonomuraea africana]
MLVRLEGDGEAATLVLNRPERHNSLVPDLLRELLDAVAAVDAGAVVLAAEGRSFSTGGDVRAFAERAAEGDEGLAAYAHEIVGLLNQTVLALLRLDVPVIAAVQASGSIRISAPDLAACSPPSTSSGTAPLSSSTP